MNTYDLCAVGVICACIMAVSLSVLRYLDAALLVKPTEAKLREEIQGIAKDLEETKVKLSLLGNRVR